MRTKQCSICRQDKPVDHYHSRTVKGKQYPYTFCAPCRVEKDRQRRVANLDKIREHDRKRDHERRHAVSDARKTVRLTERHKAILRDSRGSDRKKRRENDLDLDFILAAIAPGCSYCGDTQTKMTLDRIDNSLGHLKRNVVPACTRCNLTRGNMPYEAWLVVAEGMREARQRGLFHGWLR